MKEEITQLLNSMSNRELILTVFALSFLIIAVLGPLITPQNKP